MKVAYIAGPYRSKLGPYGIKKNIDAAEQVALKYWMKGYAVICPHKNTAFFDGMAPDHVWLEGDLEHLSRADVLVAMSTWEQSEGAKAEVGFAKSKGIEIIYDGSEDL